MTSSAKTVFWWVVGIIVVCLCIYGFYWMLKSGSYWLFYEDMVQDTVREMVKQTALK